VTFSLELSTGLPGFRRLVDRDGVLAGGEDDSTSFRLR
jgi:hypothetical protein